MPHLMVIGLYFTQFSRVYRVKGLTALKTGLWDWETGIVLQKNDAGKCPKLRQRLLLMAVGSVLKTGFWIERCKRPVFKL